MTNQSNFNIKKKKNEPMCLPALIATYPQGKHGHVTRKRHHVFVIGFPGGVCGAILWRWLVVACGGDVDVVE